MPNIKQKSATAALALLKDHAWNEITLPLLAKKAKQPLERLEKIMGSTKDLIPLVSEQIDALMLKETPERDKDLLPRELLFDILMTRFEVMAPYRFGLTSLADIARTTPEIAYPLYKAMHKSMSFCLTHACGCPRNTGHNLCVGFFVGAYFFVFIKWSRDRAPDMSRTMAGLDHMLRRLERIGLRI